MAMTYHSIASHQGFDRVVFPFSGPPTGYRVRYLDRRNNVADMPVVTEGWAIIDVVLAPIAGGFAGSPAPRLNETPGLSELRQITLLEDFEATVVHGLGVAEVSGFRVVADGNLLVVDIRVPTTLAATGSRSTTAVAACGWALVAAGVLTIRSARRFA